MLRETNQQHGTGIDTSQPQNTKLQEGLDGLTVHDRELSTLADLDHETLDRKFQYRFVYKSPLKMARMKARGYVVVDPAMEDGILNISGEPLAVANDGTYSVGDTILMKIPKVNYRAREKKKKRKTDARLKGPVRNFKKRAREQGSVRGQEIEVITKKDPNPNEED